MIFSKLKTILDERGLSINKVAGDTGLSRITLTSLANNTNKMIQYDTIDKLLKYLDVELTDLIEFYNDEDSNIFIYLKNKEDWSGMVLDDYTNLAITDILIPTDFTISIDSGPNYNQATIETKFNLSIYCDFNGGEQNEVNIFDEIIIKIPNTINELINPLSQKSLILKHIEQNVKTFVIEELSLMTKYKINDETQISTVYVDKD